MAKILYSINVTLDGCVDHRAGVGDPEIHRIATENIARADALLFGRVVYEMMESAWRPAAEGAKPEMPDWTLPFAKTIHAAKKYVVSTTLQRVDWNSELVRGDLGHAVEHLKQSLPGTILTGGVQLPLALAQLGLIDEYQFIVYPRLAGHGPTLLAGLSKYVDLKVINRQELANGAIATSYWPR